MFTGCVYKGEASQLILHYETGLRLVQSGGTTVWQFPFHRLRSSADDGHRLLWLDFGTEQSDIVSYISLPYFPYYSMKRLKTILSVTFIDYLYIPSKNLF